MKKILIFSLAYYPRVGGAEVAIKEITDRTSDIEFHLLTLRFSKDDAKEEKIGNVFVHRIGSGSGYLSKIFFVPRAAVAAHRLHTENGFDAAWVMMSYMLLPVILLRALGVRLPYVLTLQEGDTYEHMFARLRVLPFLPLLSVGFKKAAVVQTISTYLGGWARRRGFKGPLEVIPNGVDVKKFAGVPSAHQGIMLITASRLVHKNALDDVLRALPLLPPMVSFTILGTGPDEMQLKRLAHGLGVESRVRFAGYVAHEALPAELHAADIFIRTSRSEGMGNSFVEAFAAGLPVVATQEGGIADFLFDAKRNPERPATGWAVDKNSPEQIAAAVQEILGNPEQVKIVIENAKDLAVEKYDWDLIAKDMRERVFGKVF